MEFVINSRFRENTIVGVKHIISANTVYNLSLGGMSEGIYLKGTLSELLHCRS